jgi:hypothetical protein
MKDENIQKSEDLENSDNPILPKETEIPAVDYAKEAALRTQTKRWWLSFSIIFIIIAAVVAVVYITNFRDHTSNSSTDNSESSQTDQTSIITAQYPQSESLIYVHGESYNSAGSLYLRPSDGGERDEILSLNRLNEISFTTLRAQISKNYVFVKNDVELWVGKGSSKEKPTKIFTIQSNNTIGSAAISSDGSRIIFSSVPKITEGEPMVPIYIINSDGSDMNKLSDGASVSPFWFQPEYWINDSQVAMWVGAYGTDAPPPPTKIFNVDTKEFSDVLSVDDNLKIAQRPVVSPDGKQAIYVSQTVDESIKVDGLYGYYIGSPYKIHLIDLSSGESTQIAEIGQKTTINAEGYYRNIKIGWLNNKDSFSPYYTDDNQILIRNDQGEFDKYFESGQGDISTVYLATKEELIVGTKTTDLGENITHYDVAKKVAVNVMETTSDTRILSIIIK